MAERTARHEQMVRYAVAYIRDSWEPVDKVERSDMLDLLDELILKEAIGPLQNLWLGEKFDAYKLSKSIRKTLEI